MYYRILMPSGNYLEGAFSLNFELNNQVFSTSDASVLPGSFSFPADVLLTGANKVELNNPHLVTNARNWKTYDGVWVELYGQKMFYGTLKITACDKLKAKVNVVANPIARLKELDLNQIDLGGFRGLGAYGDWLELMKATVLTPEDFDFVFVPMYHEGRNEYPFDTGDPDNLLRPYFNHYDVVAEEFSENSGALVPFVKIRYLLQQIFAAADNGFTFQNRWQLDGDLEMQRLYLFNNWDMRTLDGFGVPELPSSINLTNHVPKIKATELLKKLMAQWGLGLFANVFNRSLRLVPLQSILARPPRWDWTEYAIGDYSLESADKAPAVFNYEQPEQLPHTVPEPETLQLFNTLPDINAALPGLADGYYYIETEMMVVRVISNNIAQAWLQHRGVNIGSGERLDTGMTSLLHISQSEAYNSPVAASRFYESQDSSGDTVWERQVTDPPTALLAYRGFNDVGFANDYPVASNHIWNPNETGDVELNITVGATIHAIAQRSLNWSGQQGIFNTAHRTWAYMLREGKPPTQQFALPVTALTAFSFEDKIRVGSMDYFVKKLKVGKPLGKGLVLVEASMVSVI